MLKLIFNKFIIKLPTSKSLSYLWNFGSLLFMILLVQFLSGMFLSCYYSNEFLMTFNSIQYLMYDVNLGWIFRLLHFNGASLFLLFLYFHFFKALFLNSYRLTKVWLTGLLMLVIIMAESFLGYVLVWSQMSFWAAVVITSLLSVIPFYGSKLILLVWGGYTVSSATLKFFFMLHFIIPWFLFIVILFHLLFLHNFGSSSKLMVHLYTDKIYFFPFYWYKDFLNILVFMIFIIFIFYFSYILGEYEMFVEANSMMSPVHIVPEWYFLFAYSILRSIPHKMLGIILLFLSIFIFFIFLYLDNYLSNMKIFNNLMIYLYFNLCLLLSWLGSCEISQPYISLGLFFTLIYFLLLVLFMFFIWFYYYIFF